MTAPGVITLKEVTMPGELKENEVLLRIHRIGVCGSDIHVYYGKHLFTSYPVVQGHEYSGQVVETGSLVTKVRPGMKATARPQLVCGSCGPCRRGHYHVCQNLKVQGFQADGCAQDYFVVPEDRLVVIPAGMTFEQTALVEPASVGAHSTNRTDIAGKNVVVSGAGTIGNLVAQFARARRAKNILITDLSDFRLEKARACGISNTANLKNETFEEAAERVFGKEGFQVGFEAAGVEASLSALVRNVEKGGTVAVIGVYEQQPIVHMGLVGEHELNLLGCMMYRQEDYEEAVKFLSEGKIETQPLITGHFPLEKYIDAYRFIEQEGDRTLKIMIDVND